MVKQSHIILSTMATARKVTPSNDQVESQPPLVGLANMPQKNGMYASKDWHVCFQEMACMPSKKL